MKQYFRTIGSIVAISAMIFTAASCKKDTLSEEAQQLIPGVERTISASATLPQDADKAHIDGSRKVIWDMGDELNINGTNVTISRIGPDGTVAIFDKSTVHANTVSGTDHYWAVYPTTLAGAYSGGLPSEFTSTSALTVHFPDTQIVDINATDTLNGLTYMASHVAVAPGTEDVLFPMRNLGAVLELNLTPYCSNNTRVDSIVFTSSNASLSGTFTVSADPSNPTVTPTAGSNKLVVKFQDNGNKYIDITGGKKVRVILPPIASKNLNMKIYGNGRNMGKNAASATLARNNFYSSAITFDVSLFAAPDVVGFSVAPNKRVVFSPGNLQWSATGGGTTATTHAVAGGGTAQGTWRFAEHQWDYVGDAANGNVYANGVKCNNTLVSSSYTGWIDLVGWGTSGWNSGTSAYLPYATSTIWDHYHPGGDYTNNLTGTYARADWGVYNAIYNPKTNSTDPAGTWRTLTKDEWVYLINTREIIDKCDIVKKMYGHANVNGINGIVILPDNWNPVSCPGFVHGNSAWANIFDETTTPKWTQMEALGCIFLPAAGDRYGVGTINYAGSYGRYWSATSSNNIPDAYQMSFSNSAVSPGLNANRPYGRSVRLVKEVH